MRWQIIYRVPWRFTALPSCVPLVTRRVGVSPTEIKREGDAIGTTSKKRPCSLWALHSRVNPSAPLDEHVRDVLDQLDSNKAVFEKLSREFGGTMQLVGLCLATIPSGFEINDIDVWTKPDGIVARHRSFGVPQLQGGWSRGNGYGY